MGRNSLKNFVMLFLIVILSACGSSKHTVKAQIESESTETAKAAEVVIPNTIAAKFREGSHYMRISDDSELPTSSDKIQITEFFLYSCPHCYELEPKLQKWLEKYDNVEFSRVPAILGPSWSEMAKFYYVAEKLGKLDTLHKKFFYENQQSKNKFISELSIRQYFVLNGIEESDYAKAYYDEEVMEKTSQARILSIKYNLRGVPVVIVNNKWKVAPYFVRDQEQMLELLDYLIELEAGGGQ